MKKPYLTLKNAGSASFMLLAVLLLFTNTMMSAQNVTWNTRVVALSPSSGECGTYLTVSAKLEYYSWSSWKPCQYQTIIFTLGSANVAATTNSMGIATAQIVVPDPANALAALYRGGYNISNPFERYSPSNASLSFDNLATLGTTGSINGRTTICADEGPVTYSVSEVTNAIHYGWNVPTGASIVRGQGTTSIDVVFGTASGNVTVTPQSRCHTGNTSSLYVSLILEPEKPEEIRGIQTVCKGSTGHFWVDPVAGASSYRWELPSGWSGSSTSNQITITPSTVDGSDGHLKVHAVFGDCESDASTLLVFAEGTPRTPEIQGNPTVCEGISQVYNAHQSYTPSYRVPSANSYSWTLPPGWTGNSSTDIIETIPGASGGTITLVAHNSCGSSSPRTINVAVEAPPESPGPVTGATAVCAGAELTYSTSPLPDAISYEWSVPEGWTIVNGQGTPNIQVISGATGQDGDILVTPVMGIELCESTHAMDLYPSDFNSTGYVYYSSSKNPGEIKASRVPYRGYIKFQLGDIPSDATIKGSSLFLFNRNSPLRSGNLSYISHLGHIDPVTASAGSIFYFMDHAINNQSYRLNTTYWNNNGALMLPLNQTATGIIQSKVTSETTDDDFMSIGLVRPFEIVYDFYGYGYGDRTPRLTVIYSEPVEGASSSLAVTVEDHTPPDITCPADVTLECDNPTDPSATGSPVASDNCEGNVTISYTDAIVQGCGNTETITRTWTAIDESGNESSCIQIITVVDTQAPILTLPADVTMECPANTDPAATGEAIASDACGDVEVSYSDAVVEGCGNTESITRTWTATDVCGNAVSADQLITIVDIIPPVLTCPGDVTIECDVPSDPGSLGNASATDMCDGDIEPSYTDEITPGDCPAEYTIVRTWLAVDACGNEIECDQVITVEDTNDPILTVPADVILECPANTDPAVTGMATATDACGDVTPLYLDAIIPGCGNTKTITRMWSARDECGNSARADQLITVEDHTPPVPQCQDITVYLDDNGEASIMAEDLDNGSFDACGDVYLSIEGNPGMDFTCDDLGLNVVTLTVTDECGNFATCDATVEVVLLYPELISYETASGKGGGPATVNMPALTAEGDLLVVGLMVEKGDNTNIAAPAGWNLIRRTNNSSHIGMASYYRIATASEPTSYSFVLSSTVKWSMGISRIIGAHPLNPVDVHNGATSGNIQNDQAVAPSVIPSSFNTLVLAYYTCKKKESWDADPTTTEVYDVPNGTDGVPSNMLAMFEHATGATGPKTATAQKKQYWAAQQVAIRPAGGAPAANGSTAFKLASPEMDEAVDSDETSLQIYPNPFDNSIHVKLMTVKSEKITIDLIDLNGRLVDHMYKGIVAEDEEQHFEFNPRPDLSPGAYMLIIRTDDGILLGREIIIKK